MRLAACHARPWVGTATTAPRVPQWSPQSVQLSRHAHVPAALGARHVPSDASSARYNATASTAPTTNAEAGNPQIPLSFRVRVAGESAELRAAAQLRAAAFFNYPLDRSEFAARSHRRMKADEEWAALEAKLKNTYLSWEGVGVTCFVATCDEDARDLVAAAVAAELDPSCKLPAQQGLPPQLVVGTLDLNIGARLPSEELAGELPCGSPARQGRAYLSNVCTASGARRQGIAAALVAAAAAHAQAAGVLHLYVHVLHQNAAARQFYEHRCSFVMEQEEEEAQAVALCRPSRILLRADRWHVA